MSNLQQKCVWAISIIACLSLLIVACGGNVSPQSSPDGVVRAAMQAISAGDTAKFKALTVENFPATRPAGDILYCRGVDTSKLQFEVLDTIDSSQRIVKIFLGTLELGMVTVQRISNNWYLYDVNSSGVRCPESTSNIPPTSANPFGTLAAATPMPAPTTTSITATPLVNSNTDRIAFVS